MEIASKCKFYIEIKNQISANIFYKCMSSIYKQFCNNNLFLNYKDKPALLSQKLKGKLSFPFDRYSIPLILGLGVLYLFLQAAVRRGLPAHKDPGTYSALECDSLRLVLCGLDMKPCAEYSFDLKTGTRVIGSEFLVEKGLRRSIDFFSLSLGDSSCNTEEYQQRPSALILRFVLDQSTSEFESGVFRDYAIPLNDAGILWTEKDLFEKFGALVTNVEINVGDTEDDFELESEMEVITWWYKSNDCSECQITLNQGDYSRQELMMKTSALFSCQSDKMYIPPTLKLILYWHDKEGVDSSYASLESGWHDWRHYSNDKNWNRMTIEPIGQLERYLSMNGPHSEWIKVLPSTYHDKRESIDITLVTQFSIQRMKRFELAVKAWGDGPVSAAIYLIHPWDLISFLEQRLKPCFDNVTWVLLQPDYSKNWSNYPINRLRNLAIKTVRTSHHLVIDTDFIPDKNLYRQETERLESWYREYGESVNQVEPTLQILPKLERLENGEYIFPRHSLYLDGEESEEWALDWNRRILSSASIYDELSEGSRVAFVVPCFGLTHGTDASEEYPQSMEEAKKLIEKGDAFITDPNTGHGPTSYEVFSEKVIIPSKWNTSIGAISNLTLSRKSFPLSNEDYFVVCYEHLWEPYYIVPTLNSPLYDERFYNQGGDKQAHALFMHTSEFHFLILRNHFLFHLAHEETMKWPGNSFVHQEKGALIVAAAQNTRARNEPHWTRAYEDYRLWKCRHNLFDYFEQYISWLNELKRNITRSQFMTLDVRYSHPRTCPNIFFKKEKRSLSPMDLNL